MINSFASMPYVVRLLMAIKLARKFNTLPKLSEEKQKGKIEFNSSRSFLNSKTIEKILGVDINKHKVLQISINNLNLFNKFAAPTTQNKNLEVKFAQAQVKLQDAYIVNNLLLQKLLLSKYNFTELRALSFNSRLSLNLSNSSESNAPRKAFIKLLQPNNISPASQPSPFVNSINKGELQSSISNNPNFNLLHNSDQSKRNLRLILKRFFVKADEKNLKFNYQINNRIASYLPNTKALLKSKQSHRGVSKARKNLKFLGFTKEIRKIKRISKYSLFNLVYRVRR
jgi:hypothetical protein